MKFRFDWVILGLVLYFPFEDFLLKWLPFSDRVYSFARFGSEAVLLITLTALLFDRIWKGLPIRRTPIDVLLGCFILLACVSVFLNNSSFLRAVVHLNVLVRFTAAYYIIVNLDISPAQTRRLITIILMIAVGESLVGLVQHYGGIAFWQPRETDVEVAGLKKEFVFLKSGIEEGAVIGTFNYSVAMSFFLLLSSCVLLAIIFGPWPLSKEKKVLTYAAFILVSVVTAFTYSRMAVIALILAVPLMLIFTGKKKLLIALGGLFLLLTSLFLLMTLLVDTHVGTEFVRVKSHYVNPLDNIRMMFSGEYLEKKQSGRLMYLTEVGGTIFRSGTFLGFSADEETARRRIGNHSEGELYVPIVVKLLPFEHVYWVAMFAYYGYMGLGLFVWMLYRLYRCSRVVACRTSNYVFSCISLSMTVYMMLMIISNFVNRPFISRIGSFYFWLLAGLVVSEYCRIRPRLMLSGQRNIA